MKDFLTTESIYGIVPKSSPIIEAYGKLDELYWILAKTGINNPPFRSDLGMVEVLEQLNSLYPLIGLKDSNQSLIFPPPIYTEDPSPGFNYNWDNPKIIDMHLCRVKCREVERAILRADKITPTSPHYLNCLGNNIYKLIIHYLNRKSNV